MVKLADSITKNQVLYELIKRNDDFAIFSLKYPNAEDPKKIVGYNTIIIQKYPEQYIREKLYPPREKFPHKETWEKKAWSYSTLEAAEKKYNELLNRPKKIKNETV